MRKSKLSILVISGLVIGLLLSVPALAEESEKKINPPKMEKQLKMAQQYWMDISSGMKKIGNDVQSFKKGDYKIEKLLKKAKEYEESSFQLLAKASKLQNQGLALKLKGAENLGLLQSFESSLVPLAARYNEFAQGWHDTLFELNQNMENLNRLTMLLMDDSEDLLTQVISQIPEEDLKKGMKEKESN